MHCSTPLEILKSVPNKRVKKASNLCQEGNGYDYHSKTELEMGPMEGDRSHAAGGQQHLPPAKTAACGELPAVEHPFRRRGCNHNLGDPGY